MALTRAEAIDLAVHRWAGINSAHAGSPWKDVKEILRYAETRASMMWRNTMARSIRAHYRAIVRTYGIKQCDHRFVKCVFGADPHAECDTCGKRITMVGNVPLMVTNPEPEYDPPEYDGHSARI